VCSTFVARRNGADLRGFVLVHGIRLSLVKVISEILRTAPDAKVAAWSQRQTKQTLFLSVVSMGELRKGVTILPASARRTQLEESIEAQVPLWFKGRILLVTQTIAERWGELDGVRQLAGRPLINTPDGMIAATALEHDLTLSHAMERISTPSALL
jgi:toxin FitB